MASQARRPASLALFVGVVAALLSAPRLAIAQSDAPPPAVRVMSPTRTVDVGSLPPVPLVERNHPRTPFHPTADPQDLEDYKQLLRSRQIGIRTAPHTVSDPLVGAVGPLTVGTTTQFEGLANIDNATFLGTS